MNKARRATLKSIPDGEGPKTPPTGGRTEGAAAPLAERGPGRGAARLALVGREATRPGSAAAPAPGPADGKELVIDGERLVLEGRREIELRCGAASIILQHDGKIVIKGLYVETRAQGVNRIRGGAVKIN